LAKHGILAKTRDGSQKDLLWYHNSLATFPANIWSYFFTMWSVHMCIYLHIKAIQYSDVSKKVLFLFVHIAHCI